MLLAHFKCARLCVCTILGVQGCVLYPVRCARLCCTIFPFSLFSVSRHRFQIPSHFGAAGFSQIHALSGYFLKPRASCTRTVSQPRYALIVVRCIIIPILGWGGYKQVCIHRITGSVLIVWFFRSWLESRIFFVLLSSIYSFQKSADVTAHMFRAVAKVISFRIQRLRSPVERLRNCWGASVRIGALSVRTIESHEATFLKVGVKALASADDQTSPVRFWGAEPVSGCI